MDFTQQKVLVIGLGISGKGAARLAAASGALVTAVDDEYVHNSAGVAILPISEVNVNHYGLVIVSPGVPPDHPLYAGARAAGIPIIGEMELALRCFAARGHWLGITGTNGKTTVTLLIDHVLRESGIKSRAIGNVGVSACAELLDDPPAKDEVLVVELSSFQLETMNSRAFDAAVILNITPDHLDRYPDMQAYARAKMRIALCLKEDKRLLLNDQVVQAFPQLCSQVPFVAYGNTKDCAVTYDGTAFCISGKPVMTLPLEYRGPISHDIENAMAAFVLCSAVGLNGEQFAAAWQTFKKPEHRIEYVRTLRGIDFYNDSKGTNIDAVVRAVQSFDQPLWLIVGGKDKQTGYAPWVQAFEGKVRGLFAIGEAAPLIEKTLYNKYSVTICDSMKSAVEKAYSSAREGDAVVLSPGCSSYDMFDNYEHRGNVYKTLVNELQEINHHESA